MASWLDSVFGSKPSVASFRKLDLGREQNRSIKGNIKAFDKISELGDLYTKYIVDSQNAMLPGYSDVLAKGEAGTSRLLDVGNELLTGELPEDVKQAVERSDAYTSFMGGYGGSQMSHGLTARDLGLTSLDLMKQGADMIGRGGNSAQQWSSLARGNILNPSSEFVSPMERASFDLQNNVLQQQSRQFGFNVAAAPDPMAKGVSDTLMSLVGAYLGHGMGGGGGAAAGTVAYPNFNSYQPTSTYNAGFSYDPNAFGGGGFGGSMTLGGY